MHTLEVRQRIPRAAEVKHLSLVEQQNFIEGVVDRLASLQVVQSQFAGQQL